MNGMMMFAALQHFCLDESGQDLIEYALISALIGLTVVATVRGLAVTISTGVTTVGTTLTSTV